MDDITEVAEMMVELVTAQLGEALILTDIEQATRQLLQEPGRGTVKIKVASLAPTYVQPTVDLAYGAEAGYVRCRSAKLHTLFGKVMVKRPYYLCANCHQSSYPLDAQLGLRPNALSAEVCRLAAMTGVQLPFETGRALLESLTMVVGSNRRSAQRRQDLIAPGLCSFQLARAQRPFSILDVEGLRRNNDGCPVLLKLRGDARSGIGG